ncbi:two-component system response regulator [Muriicola sp. E247]|uniref:response regulator n=1 Tax=Muriicola sp. E247 TaxID=3242730 RepID=UPI003524A349
MVVGKVKNICIIDDDPIFIYGTKRLIMDANFKGDITVFQNGEEGLSGLLQIHREGKPMPPIIFLDLNMPVMNGWEFLEAIHQQAEFNSLNFQIFILSSSIDPKDTERANSYKMVKDFISKPISPDTLHDILYN